MSMTTTAIYPNRVADRKKVEAQLKLAEFGNAETEFFTLRGSLFAKGYVRVVYGDHGPYVEFLPEQVSGAMHKKYVGLPMIGAHYEPYLPDDGSEMAIYDQKRDVKHLRNPPPGGFRGNRAEGYADYRPGMIYVSPWQMKIEVPESQLHFKTEKHWLERYQEMCSK